MVFWIAFAVSVFFIGAGSAIVMRPASGGQAMANFGVGVCLIVVGILIGALAATLGLS